MITILIILVVLLNLTAIFGMYYLGFKDGYHKGYNDCDSGLPYTKPELPKGKIYINHNKCPKCGCKETDRKSWHEECGLVEYIIKCKKCGEVKEHWSYGQTFVKNWRDLEQRKSKYRLKKDNELF